MGFTLHLWVSLCLILLTAGCSKNENIKDEVNEVKIPFTLSFNQSELSSTETFSKIGNVKGKVDLPEVSGIADSRVNNGALWAHNDKGNSNSIYLLEKSTGKIKAEYRLLGMENKDWEDIEVGPGPEKGISYLYLADIGDNSEKRKSVSIVRFKEPQYDPSHEGKTINLEPEFDVLSITYPGGSKDAETLLLDHATKDLYIVSKREFPAKVYLYPYPQNTEKDTKLTLAGTLPLVVPVGGNVHPDGSAILIKTYDKIFYWKHDIKQPLWKTLSSVPEIAPYDPIEPQGEAICFDENGGYFTLSEKENAAETFLYFYETTK